MHDDQHGWQLIIIGNGFDRACGLKPSYHDYFGPRLDVLHAIDDYHEMEWWNAVEGAGLTFWDMSLELGRGVDWCDVEAAIKRWVLPTSAENGGDAPLVDHLLKSLGAYPFVRVGEPHAIVGGRLSDEDDDGKYMMGNAARYVWHSMGIGGRDLPSRKEMFRFLRDELTRTEAGFAEYMAEQEKTGGYSNAARTLMAQIMGRTSEAHAKGLHMLQARVLSFNYTRPLLNSVPLLSEEDVVNIHGFAAGPEIVFGVDGSDVADIDALPFTKTYRVACMGTTIHRGYLCGTADGNVQRPDTIKIFGHSLGEQDYAYFQSIFDAVDLYGGETRLVFYYRPWEGRTEHDVRTDAVTKVSKLLATYGTTLNNRDHGRNLMHRLLIEGRLAVERV